MKRGAHVFTFKTTSRWQVLIIALMFAPTSKAGSGPPWSESTLIKLARGFEATAPANRKLPATISKTASEFSAY